MFSVDYIAGRSGGSVLWVEILVVALGGGIALYLAGRYVVDVVVRRVRRSDVASADVVAEVLTMAVRGEDPDVVAMSVVYELTKLLGLADCRWAWFGDPLPTADLDKDGSILFGGYRWPIEREGLPPRGMKRELVTNEHSFGWIVLVPAGPDPMPLTRLRSAATTIDILALCLAQHHRSALPGPSV